MKQIIKMICLFVCILLLQKQVKSQEYLQVGFTSNSFIPSASVTGTYTDANNATWNTYTLTCHDANLQTLFSNYTIIDFGQEFPLAIQFNHQYSDLLNRVYRIRTIQNASVLRTSIKALMSADVDDVFVTGFPKLLTETNPNDYYASNHNSNRFYTSINKSLDLIKAKGAWELTRGNENIVIGIVDFGFAHHIDIDTKVKNLSTLTVNPITQWSHGTRVAGVAAAITDNNLGISSIGNKVSVKYYDANIDYGTLSSPNKSKFPSGYSAIMKAALDGCKVINCSWISKSSTSTALPITNDYDQKVVDIVYDMGVTIIAAAGNCNTGNCYDYIYPASYNNVISVTSVGSTYNVNSYSECFKSPTSTNSVTDGFLWKDMHEKLQNNPLLPNNWINCTYGYTVGNTYEHNDRVDICAPGYNIMVLTENNGVNGDWGTSFASPHVAGAAALLYSLNPNFRPSDIEYYLKNYAENIYSVATNSNYIGLLGSGRLDAGAACAAINADDVACMPRVNNITWSTNGIAINPNDYWQYSNLKFTILASIKPEEYEWEFVSGNEVIKKTTTVPYVNLDFHNEFTTFVGPFLRESKLPLEVYVRRKSATDPDCFSAFKKESGIRGDVEGGYAANNGPYPSNICDGNIIINSGNVLGGDLKAANIYLGKDFAGTGTSVETTTEFEINAMAVNEVRMLPGFHANRPSAASFFRAFIDGNCSIPNRWKPAGSGDKNHTDKTPIKPVNSNILITGISNNLKVYPNPIINTLTLDFYSDKKTKAIVSLIDVSGRVIEQYSKETSVGLQIFQLDTKTLKKGIYIVKVVIENKQLINKVLKL